MDYRVVDSISKIEKADWDALFGDKPEGYGFYRALEESNLKEFSFFYVLLFEAGRLCCIAPVFLYEFFVGNVLEQTLGRIVAKLRSIFPRFLVFKTLFCGSPFGEHGTIGLRSDLQDRAAVIVQLAHTLQRFAEEQQARLIVFKDFCSEDAVLLDGLQAEGFFKTASFPSAIVELNVGSFDEYLGTLSHATRKDLRRKLKKSGHRSFIRTEVVDSVDSVLDDVYRLYLQTHDAGATKFERLTRDFFLSISRNLGPHCKYFLYYVHEKLAAFNLCFLYGDLLIDKFIGFDYAVSRDCNLYFVSWCYNIAWCIQHGVRHYQVGQTDYAPKTRLGARLLPLYAYARHTNFVINCLLKRLAHFLNR
ncbi:MAG: GNAT family N-acetyltransferase [Desulfobacterota bacterium]|nr:GNAT family N-acetyltransferase [Thermodesulfobacteriota bacterium]